MAFSQFPVPTVAGAKEKRIAAFTASGTWTVPSGVTYAIAHVLGGGGGVGRGGSTAGVGGNSIVAFSSTVTANGGTQMVAGAGFDVGIRTRTGPPNSGQGAIIAAQLQIMGLATGDIRGADGVFIIGGSTVTPGAGVAVTVGAGGTAGTSGSAGATGYVFIEYYE